jgi:hypothetical protein
MVTEHSNNLPAKPPVLGGSEPAKKRTTRKKATEPVPAPAPVEEAKTGVEKVEEAPASLDAIVERIDSVKEEIRAIFTSKRIITAKVRTDLEKLFQTYDDLNFAAMNEMMNILQDQDTV